MSTPIKENVHEFKNILTRFKRMFVSSKLYFHNKKMSKRLINFHVVMKNCSRVRKYNHTYKKIIQEILKC